jgi:hypothetical protein
VTNDTVSIVVRIARMLLAVLSFRAFFAALALAFAAAASSAAADPAPDPASPFVVPISELSNQQTRPYWFGSRVMTPDMGVWPDYKDALKRYPDVRPCLTEGAQTGESVNLLDFDWEKPNDFEALSVCLFRLFTSLDDLDLITEWLDVQGFDVGFAPGTQWGVSGATGINSEMIVEGYWTVEQYYAHRPSNLYKLTKFTLIKRVRISVQMISEYKVKATYFGADSILN